MTLQFRLIWLRNLQKIRLNYLLNSLRVLADRERNYKPYGTAKILIKWRLGIKQGQQQRAGQRRLNCKVRN